MSRLRNHISLISRGSFSFGMVLTAGFVLLLSSVSGVQAQSSESDSRSAVINVSGVVVQPTDTEAILLEAVYSPSFIRKQFDERELSVDPIADEAGGPGGAGLVIAQGLPNRAFRVSVPRITSMTNSETKSNLDVRIVVSHNSAPEQSSSDYLRQAADDFTLNDDGEYYFWIGGSIDISDVEEGAYEGQFLVELEYL